MRNETKHTPGPWSIEQTSTLFALASPDGFPVLRLRSGMIPVEANARLIAAAPELLAACQRAVICLQEEPARPGLARRVLQVAIANAEAQS